MNNLMVGWTTIAKQEEAVIIAKRLVEEKLAVCVQIDGPIQSYYRWESEVQSDEEYRLTIKFLESKQDATTQALHNHHSYETPQWIVVKADAIGEAYHAWANNC